ncbi:MAG: DUF1080 domain-containing protein [Planctomycetes bacterium]|nr:DUF1080 domain-containing protein [Planctomycetota bacterium]
MRNLLRFVCAAAVLSLMTGAGWAAGHADRKKIKTAFLDAKSAGIDFEVQGEYEVTVGDDPFGIQVIALGDGRFQAVAYEGGLPGAGWDGNTRYFLDGKLAEGIAQFESGEGRFRIEHGEVTGVAYADSGNLDIKGKKVLRKSPTLGAKPPQNAVVLFDGTHVDAWQNGRIVEGNLLDVGTRTKQSFAAFHLHLEFRTPFMPYARGQARGNSGVYLLDQYEIQVLDSFGLEGESNECGGIYKVARPLVNMCLPPLSWQTYDIDFTPARFNEQGKKVANAVVTVRHNGVVIHENLELPHPTPGGGRADEKPGPLFLQNHGDPVRYRNIWLVPKELQSKQKRPAN